MHERARNVLFLCTGNSARSIIAEAILNRVGAPQLRGFSAGSQPKGEVNPGAIALLRRHGHDVSRLRSKSWDEFSVPGAPTFGIIITLCDSAAAETCPIWPGHPITSHWGLPDPAAVEGTDAEIAQAFEATHAALADRIGKLVRLPLEALDPPALRAKLNEIGGAE